MSTFQYIRPTRGATTYNQNGHSLPACNKRKPVFVPPHSIKMPHLTAGHWALSVSTAHHNLSVAHCLRRFKARFYRAGPIGPLISTTVYRHTSRRPRSYVPSCRHVGYTFLLSLDYATYGRATKPSDTFQSHSVAPGILKTGCPATVIIAQDGRFGKPSHPTLFAFRFAFRVAMSLS